MGGPIVLNGRAYVRGRITGVERLAREIIGRLLSLRPDVYRLATPGERLPRAASQAWEQAVLPARAAAMRAPLVYSPANLAPLAWPRNVFVLHDASVWRTPESYSRAYVAFHRVVEAAAARRALRVITVSEFSRGELIDVLGLAPDRVVVVHNGVGEQFRPDADPGPVKRLHGLARPYVLTVASDQGRKNLPLLRVVARRLADAGVDVAWAGGQTAAPDGADSIRRLGYVDDEDLPGLYAGAEAFVLPSSYEGFGIPCVEAMACGTPVVAADRAALPETCGGAALLADPDDPDGFAEAVAQLVAERGERSRLRGAGLTRAAELTWDRAAKETDALLMELAGRG